VYCPVGTILYNITDMQNIHSITCIIYYNIRKTLNTCIKIVITNIVYLRKYYKYLISYRTPECLTSHRGRKLVRRFETFVNRYLSNLRYLIILIIKTSRCIRPKKKKN